MKFENRLKNIDLILTTTQGEKVPHLVMAGSLENRQTVFLQVPFSNILKCLVPKNQCKAPQNQRQGNEDSSPKKGPCKQVQNGSKELAYLRYRKRTKSGSQVTLSTDYSAIATYRETRLCDFVQLQLAPVHNDQDS